MLNLLIIGTPRWYQPCTNVISHLGESARSFPVVHEDAGNGPETDDRSSERWGGLSQLHM